MHLYHHLMMASLSVRYCWKGGENAFYINIEVSYSFCDFMNFCANVFDVEKPLSLLVLFEASYAGLL